MIRNQTTHTQGLNTQLPKRVSGGKGRQPPRNSVVASAETVVMLMYSARKNMANFIEEYSVM